MTQALLRLPEVMVRTGLSRSTIYRLESLNQFPRRISLSARSVAWSLEEIDRWITERIKMSRGYQQ